MFIKIISIKNERYYELLINDVKPHMFIKIISIKPHDMFQDLQYEF
jgi:hypothetical protein